MNVGARKSCAVPAAWDLSTLPEPLDPQVKRRQEPAARVAVVRFSGRASESNVATHVAQLMQELGQRHLRAKGEPVFARYDPPWTLPFLRRNEIQAEVALP